VRFLVCYRSVSARRGLAGFPLSGSSLTRLACATFCNCAISNPWQTPSPSTAPLSLSSSPLDVAPAQRCLGPHYGLRWQAQRDPALGLRGKSAVAAMPCRRTPHGQPFHAFAHPVHPVQPGGGCGSRPLLERHTQCRMPLALPSAVSATYDSPGQRPATLRPRQRAPVAGRTPRVSTASNRMLLPFLREGEVGWGWGTPRPGSQGTAGDPCRPGQWGAPVATIEHVADGPGILDSQQARYAPALRQDLLYANTTNRPLCLPAALVTVAWSPSSGRS